MHTDKTFQMENSKHTLGFDQELKKQKQAVTQSLLPPTMTSTFMLSVPHQILVWMAIAEIGDINEFKKLVLFLFFFLVIPSLEQTTDTRDVTISVIVSGSVR